MKKVWALCLTLIMVSSLAGCGATQKEVQESSALKETQAASVSTDTEAVSEEKEESNEPVTLTLTFHFEDTYVQPIIDEFEKLHPNVTIDFRLSKDSDEAVLTRIVGGGGTDVDLIPSIMSVADYPSYFADLGSAQEIGDKYYYGDYMQVDGSVYGLPIGVVYEGLMYNQNLLDQYYEGKVPRTLDELMECCEIMHENGITCFYTNAGSSWPCRYWNNLAITMSEKPDYANEIVTNQEPWAEGTPLRQAGELLADMAASGWLEKDVVTSDQFDASVVGMAQGETAFILTGTWALPMGKNAAEELGMSRDSIGFAPFPYKNDVSADNPLYMRIAQDLFVGVNKNSKHPDLAKEFAAFFCERISLPIGMNEIMKDGGKTQDDLAGLADLDYMKVYTSPAKDPAIQEKGSKCELDVFQYDGFLLEYVILPVLDGKEPQFDELNRLWAGTF